LKRPPFNRATSRFFNSTNRNKLSKPPNKLINLPSKPINLPSKPINRPNKLINLPNSTRPLPLKPTNRYRNSTNRKTKFLINKRRPWLQRIRYGGIFDRLKCVYIYALSKSDQNGRQQDDDFRHMHK
jgi:hypothetical protein